MTFVPREYEAIVRDLLTTLTGGTVRESLTAPGEGVLLTPQLLRNRPVRRISHLTGTIRAGERELPYRFTQADFELVSSTGDPRQPDAIRFRPEGRRPIPGSQLVVNYYPVEAPQTPLTDVNVGSVTRTLVETWARELALAYLQLEKVYESAFVETAEGGSLDRVVALVGARRLPATAPVAKLRFTRAAGTTGRITVPAGTPVTDGAGNRYRTLTELTLEPGEQDREVQAAGEGPATEPVDAGALRRPEIEIAGIARVENPQPARRLGSPESDDDLRRRARAALNAETRGTVDALRYHLLSFEEVGSVAVVEMPNGVPGEVRVDVGFTQDSPEARERVRRRIEEIRPAGIRVITGEVGRRRVALRVALTLTGAGVTGPELQEIRAAVESALRGLAGSLQPGAPLRRGALVAACMRDARVADAAVTLLPEGGSPVEDLTPAPGELLEVTAVDWLPAQFEQAPGAQPAVTAAVSLSLPVHLQPGITLEQARAAIRAAVESHLRTRSPEAALTVDGLAAALRDPTRFVLVRTEAQVVVESGDRFVQLVDGVGAYTPAPGETLTVSSLELPVREGSV